MSINMFGIMTSSLKRAFAPYLQDIILKRRAAGGYTNGLWVDGSYTDSTIQARVQNSRPDEIKKLPENRRTEKSITIWAELDLNTLSVTNQTQPDRIIWKTETYEVVPVEDWDTQGGFYKAIAVRVGQ